MSIEFRASRQLGPFRYDAALEAHEEIVVLFGHSGAGKSLTLQFIAGLMRPETGRIAIEGRTVFDSASGVALPPQERGVGYVVQDLALFPHMDVAANIAFGARGTRRDRDARVRELTAQFGLSGMEQRMPRTLSGGQQQRVALARALARDARVLLLDEPFSALDDSLRASLRRELLRLRSDLGLTILFVTHDLREAHLLADRIAVFDGGGILQLGARDDVFRRPGTRRVAELTGVGNILAGIVCSTGPGFAVVDAAGLSLRCPAPSSGVREGEAVHLAIRSERVVVHRRQPEAVTNLFEAVIEEEYSFGSLHTLRFRVSPEAPLIEAEVASRPYEILGLHQGGSWTIELPAGDLHLMPVRESA